MQNYVTDLTDDQWNDIAQFIPLPRSGGRPQTTSMRRTIDAIFYLVRTGCQWRQLPHDFPPWQTVYRYFTAWTRDGVIADIQRVLHRLLTSSLFFHPC